MKNKKPTFLFVPAFAEDPFAAGFEAGLFVGAFLEGAFAAAFALAGAVVPVTA
jgi:hypothetical protein